ncbi:MAG: phospholipase [Dysgonamonadaceae bacterium]|jgi:hypothetical protein|nr:phospholipase [Dysgonamonadaceae bacterium]
MKLHKLFTSENNPAPEHSPESGECCGTCGDCEKSNPTQQPIQYYDDEELDVFVGRSSDSYSDEEVEQFAYVFRTLWESDVAGWVNSIRQRGIEIPDKLKDEVLLYLS